MTSQIIELFVFNNKTISSLKSVVDSVRNRRRTMLDLLLNKFKHQNMSHGAHQEPEMTSQIIIRLKPHPSGRRHFVPTMSRQGSAELSVLNNKTVSLLKFIVDSARNRRCTMVDHQRK